MDDAEIAELARLLEKCRAEGLVVPSLPLPVWRALAGVTPHLAVEVLIGNDDGEVLLTWRDDADFHGWHVPGGWMACGESVPAACDRVARRELDTGVRMDSLLDAHVWPDHPYASAVSLLCACTAETTPTTGRWFAAPPEGMVPHHGGFVRAFLEHRGAPRPRDGAVRDVADDPGAGRADDVGAR